MEQIIVINPGSTSTKTAVYDGERQALSLAVDHPSEELAAFAEIVDQLPYRREVVESRLLDHGVRLEETRAFSAICTGLLPMEGGVYEVNETMYAHGAAGVGSRHPGNLGPMLAMDLARKYGARAFVVDPSSVDEFCPEARLTGMPGILRSSRGHPLNQRAVGRRYAAEHGRRYEELNLVIAHLGGGISVSAHRRGRMIDTVDSTRGEGRMAPTRSGAVPAADLIELCFSGRYGKKELLNKVMKSGGWTALLGTADAREAERRIQAGDRFARLVYEGTAYQTAKDIAACASVLEGDVDAVLLTGGIAHSKQMTELIARRVRFIAPVELYPGEFEMDALAEGALRVLRGAEIPKTYTGEPVFKGFEEALRK